MEDHKSLELFMVRINVLSEFLLSQREDQQAQVQCENTDAREIDDKFEASSDCKKAYLCPVDLEKNGDNHSNL